MKKEKIGFFDRIKQNREEKLAYHKKLSELKTSEKVNLNSLISDMRLFKTSRWERIKFYFISLFSGKQFCWVLLYRNGNENLLRPFPMPRPFVVDINNEWYLFSPEAFRYVNKTPILEFYEGVPFAILHKVNKSYTPPSVDAKAFTTVQQSKFVQDAAKTDEEQNINVWLIACIVLTVIAIIIGIFNAVQIGKIIKVVVVK